MKKPGLQKRIFASMLKKSDGINYLIYGKYKKELFKNISGMVAEIGPGTGVNFEYLPAGTEWIGIEPNEALHDILLQKSKEKGIRAKLVSEEKGQFPLAANSVDVFLCTLVLCSVKKPSDTVAEIKRVLKPGGKLILIEHVVSERQGLRMLQYLLSPIVQFAADGCHCTRKTWEDIEQGGFTKVELNHFEMEGPLLVHKPHIIGYAIK